MHMGDGGVACLPLQHIMDGFSTADRICRGNNGFSSTTLSSMSFSLENNQMMVTKEELFSEEVVIEGEVSTQECDREVGHSGMCLPVVPNEEVEEGELCTLKWPTGDARDDVQKKEHVDEWSHGEADDSSVGKISEIGKEGTCYERGRNEVLERGDSGLARDVKCDMEGAKLEADEKTCSESGVLHDNNSPCKILVGLDKNSKRTCEHADEGSYLGGQSNRRTCEREWFSSTRSKHCSVESDSKTLKYEADRDDARSFKSRRLSDDNARNHTDRYSRHSEERSYRESYSRYSSYETYNSNHRNSSSFSRTSYRRHGSNFPDRSPRHRDRRNRSPMRRDKSPNDHGYRHDRTSKSPNSDKSPRNRVRHRDRREYAPNRSPYYSSRRSGPGDKRHIISRSKVYDEKPREKDVSSREQDDIFRQRSSCSKKSLNDSRGRKHLLCDGSFGCIAEQDKNRDSQSPRAKRESSLQSGGAPEPQHSMEEDMDICNTPPHSTSGKWLYIDHYGVERGPCKLCDLKKLMEDGILVSDHLVKQLDSDRWATVENAVSPSLTSNDLSVTSDCIPQMVVPPEASGNLLPDMEDAAQPEDVPFMQDIVSAADVLEDFFIDERVDNLLKFHSVLPGMELETLEEALGVKFDHPHFEELGRLSEGLASHQPHIGGLHRNGDDRSQYSENSKKDSNECGLITSDDKFCSSGPGEIDEQLNCLWPCKGGDWVRNDEIMQDKCGRKRFVLNHGFPLCGMSKSMGRDPRRHRKDELYHQSHNRKLHLPSWAFYCANEGNEFDAFNKSSQAKSFSIRGLKGSPLSVIKTNAHVVKDYGSFVPEPLTEEKCASKPSWSSSSCASDGRGLINKPSSSSSRKNGETLDKFPASVSTPKDHVCTADELQLHLGDWYYINGLGQECGPFAFSDLQRLVDHGFVQKNSSVFRKYDKVWVPVNIVANCTGPSTPAFRIERNDLDESGDSFGKLSSFVGDLFDKNDINTSLFHSTHPQFIGFMRGKLHELAMKSYESREFVAAIDKVLDPWINAKQPKKEPEKHLFSADADSDGGISIRGVDVDCDAKDESQIQKDEFTFEDLCADATFCNQCLADSDTRGSWCLLDGLILARIFHFLRNEAKSLIFASLTCNHWKAAFRFYKEVCRKVDLSSLGPSCSDSVVQRILNDYNSEKVTSVVLAGCTSLSMHSIEGILLSFKSLSSVDIRGCSQLADLPSRFPYVNWIKGCSSLSFQALTKTNNKNRNVEHMSESSLPFRKNSRVLVCDEFSELKDYFDAVDKRNAAKQMFRQNLYKRSKLFDVRKSSSILSRDARMRRWAMKKPDNGYKRTEEFLAFSLKSIMRENSFDFFKPKIAEIEERMKNGYYARRGLKFVREDINCMCKEAIRNKYHGNNGNLNHMIALFVDLALHLEENFKLNAREVSAEFGTKHKNVNKLFTDRRSLINGPSDSRNYISDREVRRRLSELNKRLYGSGSDVSDDLHGSSADSASDGERTGSDAESYLDFKMEVGLLDGGLHSLTSVREWGARMTEVSLVPPVTRKYEVIDEYFIVVDEEDVRRKMQVSLPEDYLEKLRIQENGIEESDMEIPEVKNFKPRKNLGDEVVEQEVYGIDPYTHNLLLDSMPDDCDWPLLEKHLFIEDVLLRTLNKQVRFFTGTGYTPMTYPLQSVVEEIQKIAEKEHDMRTKKMCSSLLESMDCRLNDKYVAYRKGLGVVCNKNNGFSEDDFVVEFLGEVYPAWKWFEKQDGIRSLQKDSNDPAPEFYNIYLERPKGDADGYDLVVVDAMHKANYASRICHSCQPNCEAKVTAVNGQYQIGIYTVRNIQYGEEITFDYNSVTESKEEYDASVCLCGGRVCRGSYLNLTGEGAFLKVLKEWHGLLDRFQLMLEACEAPLVSEDDYIDLGKAGLGSCLLGGLPDWLVAYSARLVRFINFERTKLPDEILRHNLEEKQKYFTDISLEVERSDAEVQAEGVFNQRLQNLALTLDKVRYVMKRIFGDAKNAPPPLERLSAVDAARFLWKGEGSLVEELLNSITPHTDEASLVDLNAKIRARDPSNAKDSHTDLRTSLLWLRDELRNLPCTSKSRHDATSDVVNIYAHTKSFFKVRKYQAVTSLPVYISPLDLGPNYCNKIGPGPHKYCKTYGENYCLGQLMYWYNQTSVDPDLSLAKASRGCLSLPGMGSFYVKPDSPSQHLVYGPRIVRSMLGRMEKQPQRPWPDDGIWQFHDELGILGTPMLDAVLVNGELDREMVHWLRTRPVLFDASWDR